MDYIIERRDTASITQERQWLLLYGRRKVGKTFLLRNLCTFKKYYTVKKDLGIIAHDITISLDDMMREVKKLLHDGQTVVIDEFQRLPESVLEELTVVHPHGKLILSGSSLRILKKIFEPQSPLLGFLNPVKMGFISPSDILIGLHAHVKSELLVELSTFLREPWLIPSYDEKPLIDFIYKLITQSKQTLTALVGEIFGEEERELTGKYSAIIGLIGSGIWNTTELTSILYSRKLIPEPSPTHLAQYLKNLEEMEIVESIKMYSSKRKYYRLASPLMNVYYYLESRYNINDRQISLEEIRPTLQKSINFEIQNFIADLFSEIYSGRKEYFISPDKEIDFIITVRNKPSIIGEVKWKALEKEDIRKFFRNSEKIFGRKIIFCKSSKFTEEDVEIMNVDTLLPLIKEKRKMRIEESARGFS